MQFKFFRIPIPDLGGFTEKLNAFLRGQRILSVRRESNPGHNPVGHMRQVKGGFIYKPTGPQLKERRSMSADDHGKPMNRASAPHIASSWTSANTFRRSLVLNLTRMPVGIFSDPAAIPPAPSHPAWQAENARPVPVGGVDATPNAPGVAAASNRQAQLAEKKCLS